MRVFGLACLLVALAILGISASRQLRTVGRVPSFAAEPASRTAAHETPQQLPETVRREVTKALEQGAARRNDAAQ